LPNQARVHPDPFSSKLRTSPWFETVSSAGRLPNRMFVKRSCRWTPRITRFE
jgi:hypothetical protein